MIYSRFFRRLIAVGVLAVALPAVANAQTLAHWRFEDADGDVGERLYAPNLGATGQGGIRTAGANSGQVPIADISGNGNNLRTFHTDGDGGADNNAGFDSSPTFSANVPSATVVQSGAANTKSLLFDGGDDIYTRSTDNGNGPINVETFDTGFTIEMSFNLSVTDQYDTLLGRDAFQVPGAGDQNAPAIQFQTIGSDEAAPQGRGSFAVKVWSTSGVNSTIYSLADIQANVWYNMAVVSTNGVMSFYLAQTGSPLDAAALQGTTAQDGSIYAQINPGDPNGRTWTLGRGMYGNNVTDFINGNLDEVRITKGGLATSALLANSAPVVIPESGTGVLSLLGFVGIAGVAVLRRAK